MFVSNRNPLTYGPSSSSDDGIDGDIGDGASGHCRIRRSPLVDGARTEEASAEASSSSSQTAGGPAAGNDGGGEAGAAAAAEAGASSPSATAPATGNPSTTRMTTGPGLASMGSSAKSASSRRSTGKTSCSGGRSGSTSGRTIRPPGLDHFAWRRRSTSANSSTNGLALIRSSAHRRLAAGEAALFCLFRVFGGVSGVDEWTLFFALLSKRFASSRKKWNY